VFLAIARRTDEPKVRPDVIVTHGLEVISVAPELTKQRLPSVKLLQRGVVDVELGIVLIAARLVLSTVELADNRLDVVYRELAVILRFVALHEINLGSAAAIEAKHDSRTIDLPGK
jgi:hypothetical protein